MRDIAYGPGEVRRLEAGQALMNADSYTYYAIGEFLPASFF
jgi:hypothetical protein